MKIYKMTEEIDESTKISFTVVFKSKKVDGIEKLHTQIWNWTTKMEINKIFLKKTKKAIKLFVEGEGNKVVSIKLNLEKNLIK